MSKPVFRAGVLVVLLLTVAAGIGAAQDDLEYVRGAPDLDVYVPDPTLNADSTSELAIQIANDGEVQLGAVSQRDIVTTARGVTVDIEADGAPITVETRKQSIGSVADGEFETVPITVTVPKDVEPGTYSLDVNLRYSHTYQFVPTSGVTQEHSRRTRESIDVQLEETPRFELTTVESDVQVGGSGTVITELANVGTETARDLTVELESSSPDVTLGETARNTARIDRLAPGENTTLTYETNVRPDVPRRNISLSGMVTFIDSGGEWATKEGLSVGFRPEPEQTVSVSVNRSTLRVGETGSIRGSIRNGGPAGLKDLVLSVGETQFQPRSPTYAVGELQANESATFQFRGTVPSEGDAVPQRIEVITRYRTAADTRHVTSDSLHVPVFDRRDAVAVTAPDPEFAAGEEGVLKVEVTNQRDVEISDVRLDLTVEDPLASEFQRTVLPSLRPGETGRVAFDLEVDRDAPVSRYPATIEVQYRDRDAEMNTARQSTVAIRVTGSDGGGPPIEITIFGILSLVVLVGAWVFYRW
jgi:hypothetical protein